MDAEFGWTTPSLSVLTPLLPGFTSASQPGWLACVFLRFSNVIFANSVNWTQPSALDSGDPDCYIFIYGVQEIIFGMYLKLKKFI